jgi:hypothetical protein
MIGRSAIRLLTVNALIDRTIVGGNVQDSSLSAIDIEADGTGRTEEDRPFISVYTDDGTATEDETVPRNLFSNGEIDLVFEFGVATPMTVIDDETGENRILGLPSTDGTFELTLDVIDRGISIALTDPDNEWSEIWRRMVWRVSRIERRRMGTNEDGQRFAARQVRYTIAVLPDPVPGEPLNDKSPWMMFKSKVDADLPHLSEVVSSMLGEPGNEVTLKMIQQSRGHTDREMRAFGLFHPTPDGPGEYTIETTEPV